VAHAGVFAVLAVCIGLASGWRGWRGWRLMLLMMGSTLLLGGLDEWHQFYLPGRHAQWEDLVADALGGLIGAGLVLRFGGQAQRL
jgi:VanZ family protein